MVDERGREQARGKDLEALKAPLRPRFDQALAEVASDSGLARSGETTWTFGTLEPSLTRKRAGHEVRVHPALIDEGATVGLGVFGSEEEAAARHRLGVRRLVLLGVDASGRVTPAGTVKGLLDGLGNAEKLVLAGSPYPSVAELVADCRAAVVGEVVDAAIDAGRPVRDRAGYDALVAAAGAALPQRLRPVLDDVMRVLEAWRKADKALTGRAEMAMLPALADLKGQLERLVHAGFVGEAGPTQLRRYPTYLSALVQRRQRLDEGAAAIGRDRQLMDRVTDLQEAWLHQVAALPAGRPPGASLRQARWMLEEYRVSLFAQQLGTPYPVSDQRIRKVLG